MSAGDQVFECLVATLCSTINAWLLACLCLQVHLLLMDPCWLEVKLHCYGVAAVVDDFRSYLQVRGLGAFEVIWVVLNRCVASDVYKVLQQMIAVQLRASGATRRCGALRWFECRWGDVRLATVHMCCSRHLQCSQRLQELPAGGGGG